MSKDLTQITQIETRVNKKTCPYTVQFLNAENVWQTDISVTFTSAGKLVFSLNPDIEEEPYIFFGAFQQTKDKNLVTGETTPDTNWDFVINGKGNLITFTNTCLNQQDIDIRLTLVERDAEAIDNAIVSADPKIKNEPN